MNLKVEITIVLPTGPAKCAVNYPSDQQWIERRRRRGIRNVSAGRKLSRIDVEPCDEFDLELLRAIAADGVPDGVDSAAAARVMDHLDSADADVDEVVSAGVSLKLSSAFGYEATQLLTYPSARAMLDFERGAYQTMVGKGFTITRVNLAAGATLFEACGGAHEIPIPFKFAAAQAMVNHVSGLAAGDTADF